MFPNERAAASQSTSTEQRRLGFGPDLTLMMQHTFRGGTKLKENGKHILKLGIKADAAAVAVAISCCCCCSCISCMLLLLLLLL